jgi:CheY-like chemotaxis protein
MKNISSTAKILLVEDEAIIAADISARLVQMGYTVSGITGNGEEAIALTAKHQPDVVLMDIMLEGPMFGTEAATRIRSEFNLPVIFVTANSDDITLDYAFSASPFGYVLKPFEDRELRVAIEMGLYRHRVEMEREKLVGELRQALEQVKALSGLLPICIECKSIRDDKGYWSKVERYIMEHSQASFSHGLCPNCAVKALENVGCDVPTQLRDAVRKQVKN